jgi:hypothetical protein
VRLLILVSTLLLAQTAQNPSQPAQSQKTGDNGQEIRSQVAPLSAPPNSVNTAVPAPPSNSEKTSTANSYSDGPYHSLTYLNALFTLAIAVFSFLTWRIYKAMLRATKITERCWLVSAVGSIEDTQVNGKYQVIVKIPNNGNTPAWVTAAGSRGSWVDDKNPLPEKPGYDLMGPFPPNGQLLPPTAWLLQGFPLEKTKLDQVVNKSLNLYIIRIR